MGTDFSLKSYTRETTCALCGKLIITNNPMTKYCSWKCSELGRKLKMREYKRKKAEEKILIKHKTNYE